MYDLTLINVAEILIFLRVWQTYTRAQTTCTNYVGIVTVNLLFLIDFHFYIKNMLYFMMVCQCFIKKALT